MNIYEIKRRTQETEPYFFCSKTMKQFGQTLKDFKVWKDDDSDRYVIFAPIKVDGKIVHHTTMFFNPLNNKIESK